MTRHHQPTRRVNPTASIIPKPLQDGKARCPGCSRVLSITPNGRLRQHNAPSGEPCAVRTVVAPNRPDLTVVPPVAVPARKGSHVPLRLRPDEMPTPEVIAQDATLAPAIGACHDCGRWLPGERKLCGQCARLREEARRRR